MDQRIMETSIAGERHNSKAENVDAKRIYSDNF